MAVEWNKQYESGRDYRVMNQLLLNDILASAKISTGGTVLDIGCGTGDLAVKLAQRGYFVTGIDLAESAINLANARSDEARTSDKTNFLIGSVESESELSQVDDLQFNLITCKLVYAFIVDKKSFLNWIKRHLLPDGYLVIITPVLHEGINYSPRMTSISVSLKNLEADLAPLGELKFIHKEYFELYGEERTVIVKMLNK
jgi:2-polyprenyl-3-methyl-5-hydroxy-6-metoxy-1,4-benzoquinol methylase